MLEASDWLLLLLQQSSSFLIWHKMRDKGFLKAFNSNWGPIYHLHTLYNSHLPNVQIPWQADLKWLFSRKISSQHRVSIQQPSSSRLSNQSICPYRTNSLGVTKTSTAVTINIYRSGHNQFKRRATALVTALNYRDHLFWMWSDNHAELSMCL